MRKGRESGKKEFKMRRRIQGRKNGNMGMRMRQGKRKKLKKRKNNPCM